MLQAMYESNENNLAQKLQDYDYCNYQGFDWKFIWSFCKRDYFLKRARTSVIALQKCTNVAWKKIQTLSPT